MRFLLKIYLFFISCQFLTAQSNLVPNPSFETYTACPTAGSEIYDAVPWTGPTTNSTDYINACNNSSSSGFYRVPSITGGYYQWPRTGNAYAIFWAAFNGPNYREYLQSPLSNNLQIGKCYYIEFYVNVANYTRTGVNNIGANLTDTIYPTNLQSSGTILNLPYHALRFGNPIITDTLNWVQVSGIYRAHGGENQIIIGNFKDDAHTDSIHLGSSLYPAAYYYLDDVSVTPTDSINMSPYAGNDTIIAAGDSAFIGQQLYGLNCNWYSNNVLLDTNISGIWVKPTVNTTYVVEQNLCGNVGYDTVKVSVVGVAGIKQLVNNRKQITVYPNPTSEQITITVSKGEVISTVSIYDVLGNEVLQSFQKEIDVRNLVNGIYFIQIKTLANNYTQKVVVQH